MIYEYLLLILTGFVFLIYFALTFPYQLFALKIMIGKLKYKSNTGLIFMINKAGNFGFPYVVDMRQDTFKIKKDGVNQDYPITKNMVLQGTFFGLPYFIYDIDDVKTTVGLYYHSSDDKGNPLFYDKTTVPVLSAIKESVTLSPSFLEALVGDRALTEALKELFNKHKTLVYILGGLAIATAFNVYVIYEFQNVSLPEIMNILRSLQ